jgi:hypothetical protein
MAIKLNKLYFILIFLLGLWIFAGPGGSGPPAQLQESHPPGLTIDDNFLVLILAIFFGIYLYTVIRNKTPI